MNVEDENSDESNWIAVKEDKALINKNLQSHTEATADHQHRIDWTRWSLQKEVDRYKARNNRAGHPHGIYLLKQIIPSESGK